MEQQIINWLRTKLKTQRYWRVVAMSCSLLAGVLILYVSFWVSYWVIWMIFSSCFPLKREVILLLAGAFMTLVVIVGARQNLADLDPLQRQVRMARDMDITLTPYTRYGMSWNTNAMKAAVFEVRSLAAVINYILCGGVKLLFGAVAQWRRFRRLGTVDVNAAAQVLELLHAAGKRQSFAQILEKLPDLNPIHVSYDLRCVEGILFLSSEPPGLALHPDLRDELDAVLPITQLLAGERYFNRRSASPARPEIRNPKSQIRKKFKIRDSNV
jgi:hypothetical protein